MSDRCSCGNAGAVLVPHGFVRGGRVVCGGCANRLYVLADRSVIVDMVRTWGDLYPEGCIDAAPDPVPVLSAASVPRMVVAA